MRPSHQRVNIEIAEIISQRSVCKRAKVGCAIVRDNRVISTGYNGPLKSVGDVCSCDPTKGCVQTIHAEANAIYSAAKHGISLNGADLYCTYSPCSKCAEAIIQVGIARVFYSIEYRDSDPLRWLVTLGISCYPIPE